MLRVTCRVSRLLGNRRPWQNCSSAINERVRTGTGPHSCQLNSAGPDSRRRTGQRNASYSDRARFPRNWRTFQRALSDHYSPIRGFTFIENKASGRHDGSRISRRFAGLCKIKKGRRCFVVFVQDITERIGSGSARRVLPLSASHSNLFVPATRQESGLPNTTSQTPLSQTTFSELETRQKAAVTWAGNQHATSSRKG